MLVKQIPKNFDQPLILKYLIAIVTVGVFALTRIPQSKIQEVVVKVHRRTPQRALDKVKTLRKDAVHPAKIQRYLSRWASWWQFCIRQHGFEIISFWVVVCREVDFTLAWFGWGLLPTPYFLALKSVLNQIT